MWPFKRKESDPCRKFLPEDDPAKCAEKAVNVIAIEFPLGSSFDYLGKTMVVRAHSERMFMHGGAFGAHCIVDAPALIVDYLDGSGVIQSKTFDAAWVIARMESRK